MRSLPDSQAAAQRMPETAIFEPRGLSGLIYWYTVLPFHGVVFRTMLAGIQRNALSNASGAPALTALGAAIDRG